MAEPGGENFLEDRSQRVFDSDILLLEQTKECGPQKEAENDGDGALHRQQRDSDRTRRLREETVSVIQTTCS